MTWRKIDRNENAEGTTITYRLTESKAPILVQSRMRHIPHASRTGTWDHTTYFVLYEGRELKECYSLKDAKAYAEGLVK